MLCIHTGFSHLTSFYMQIPLRCEKVFKLKMVEAGMSDLCNICFVPSFHNWKKKLLLDNTSWSHASCQIIRTILIFIARKQQSRSFISQKHIDGTKWVSVRMSYVFIYKIAQWQFEYNGCNQEFSDIKLLLSPHVSSN